VSVTETDIGGTVPDVWIDAVNGRLGELHHEDQCACGNWPEGCVSGYYPAMWEASTAARVAAVVLEPLIRERIAVEKRMPNLAVVSRQLTSAGYPRWDGRRSRDVPGFKVARNRSLTPDGLVVIHMGQFDDRDAMEAAHESYARTLCSFGYDARIEHFTGTLRAVRVRRSAAPQRGGARGEVPS
jgi:hypothetical protein